MHAIAFLKKQHGEAKAALREIESAAAERRGGLWEELRPELALHETLEEQHLYGPVAREVQSDRILADWERTHHQEVTDAETLIREIDGLKPSDAPWLEAVRKLRASLERHIETEERTIWPAIERVWDASRLEEAGQRMQAAKREKALAAR